MQLDFRVVLQLNSKNWFVVVEKVTILRGLTDTNKIKMVVLVVPNPKACRMKPTWMLYPIVENLGNTKCLDLIQFSGHVFWKLIVCIDRWSIHMPDFYEQEIVLCSWPMLYSQCVWKVI